MKKKKRKPQKTALRNALQDMTLIVDVISHTENTVRTAKWWAQVRERVCERHGIPSLYGRQPSTKLKRTRPVLYPQMARVLELAAEGYTTKETAEIMGLTENTIKTHRLRSLKALDANNITHAVVIAIRQGILEGAPSEQEVGDLDRAIERDLDPPSGGGSDADGERDSVGQGEDLPRDLVGVEPVHEQ